jgi:hypothetical protein
VIAPGITDAMFYFEVDVLGFDQTNFAWINLISSIASIVGIWCYRALFKLTPLWKYLLITTIFYSLIQSSNLLLATQHTYWLGLSAADFTYVNSFLYGTVNELHLMPLMVMACYMCPKDVETTFYALVLAVINAGYLLSYWSGALFTILLGISSEDFSKFWVLILISSVWPLVTLLYLLVLPKENELGVKGITVKPDLLEEGSRHTSHVSTNLRDSFAHVPSRESSHSS